MRGSERERESEWNLEVVDRHKRLSMVGGSKWGMKVRNVSVVVVTAYYCW